MPETRRLFFALWPPAPAARALHSAGHAAHAACQGRPMRRDTLHMTLAFLGEVPVERLAVAEAAAAGIAGERFVLELDRLGWWKHNRILWAGCSAMPPALARLAGDLARSLRGAEFQLDERPFAAHVTLLRNAVCAAGAPALAEPIHWPVDEFALIESHVGTGGSRYEALRRWPLAGAVG